MRNKLDVWLRDSIHPIADIVFVASRLTTTYKVIRQKLEVADDECPLTRLSLVCALIDCGAQNLRPNCRNMSELTALPCSTICKWFKRKEQAGILRIEMVDGHHYYNLDRPLRSDAMEMLDHITSNHKRGIIRDVKRATVEHRQRAMQLAAQLPDNYEDASLVLSCLSDLTDKFTYPRAASSSRSNIALLKPSVLPLNK